MRQLQQRGFFRKIFCSLLLFVTFSALLHAQKRLSLQPYHWVYEYADELRLRHPGQIAFWAIQPVDFNDSARLLKTADSSSYTAFLARKIARDLYQFGRRGKKLLRKPYIFLGTLITEKYGSFIGNDHILNSIRLYSGARFSPRLSIFNAMDVDQNLGEDKDYLGKTWRDVSALTEQAYIQYHADRWRVKFGRDYLRWGRAQDAALAVSHASRPFDQFFLQLRTRRAQFSYFISKLNSIKSAEAINEENSRWLDRFMSGGRLDFSFFNHKLELAVSQFVLWGGTHGLEFYYLNPFLFYHGEQLNEDPEIQANTIGLFDFSYFPKSGFEIYGQLLIDDVQIEKKVPGDLEPNEYGILLGGRCADIFGFNGLTLGLEYTRVTNRTYNTLPAAEKYEHRNKPIGHFLGNDFDRWLFTGRKYLWKNLLLSSSIDIRRHGVGRFNGEFDMPWLAYSIDEGYSEPFPSGVVEYSRIYEFNLRWHPRPDFYLSLFGRAGNFSNYQNKTGKTRNNRELFLRLWYAWSFFSEI